MHTQLKVIRDSKPPVQGDTPWIGEELRHFWAMANQLFGKAATARVYDMMAAQCQKSRMHELTRKDFVLLLNDLRFRTGQQLDEIFRKTEMWPSWLRIRWLQRELKWSDGRLVNYILWHGKKTDNKIDHIRWLTVIKARGIIVGMQRILDKGRG